MREFNFTYDRQTRNDGVCGVISFSSRYYDGDDFVTFLERLTTFGARVVVENVRRKVVRDCGLSRSLIKPRIIAVDVAVLEFERDL